MGTRTEVTVKKGQVKEARPVPFVVVAPLAVMLLGALITLTTLLLGVSELEDRARSSAAFHSEVLARTLAARLSETDVDLLVETMDAAAIRAGDRLILLDGDGAVVHVAGGARPQADVLKSLRAERLGFLSPESGDVAFYTAELDKSSQSGAATLGGQGERIVALSQVPSTSSAERSLLTSLTTFSALLLGAAGIVAWALARDVHADVLYLRGLIVQMAEDKHTPFRKAIAVRSIDQVGQLTASFNHLLERFEAAERAYRQDLTEANAFDKDRAAFLAALSHELRTPLNAILGFTDVLLSEIDGPLSADAHENLTIVRTSGEHLRSLIDDILALSALESGTFRLSREDLDVAAVANDVVTEARVTAAQKGLVLELAPVESPMTAHADRRRLRQILQNVISNAIKFTSEGGVTVTVTREDNDIVTRVTDTGPGIEPDDLGSIFNEFEQSGSGYVKRQGTGLGLSITKRLVLMHGGSVRADSVLGQGSVFSVRIPIEERPRASIDPIVQGYEPPIIREAKV